MAAEVESMFSVREVPWHGLGTIVEDAPTSKDAIVMAGLDWNVVQKPIYQLDKMKPYKGILYDAQGNQVTTPLYEQMEIGGFVANVRDTDNSVLGIVTPKYKIVQNVDAFEFTDSLLGEDVKYETAGSLKDGRTIWLLARMPEYDILGDEIVPYICFANTHDGTGAVKVCMTNTRVVCNNTLNIALNSAKQMWSTKHMGNLTEKLSEAKHTLFMANKYNEELAIEAEKLADIKISDSRFEEIIDLLNPIDYENDSERKINNTKNIKEELFKCYNMYDISKFRGTGWGVVNAVADYVSHHDTERHTDTYTANRWGKIMAGNPELNKYYTALQKVV